MCGIGGILRSDGQPIPEEWLDRIDARIAYRGPDGHGRFRDRVEFVDDKGEKRVVEVAFVHRRLSIIDHQDGHQPMVSERGRNENEGLVAVVFNGCIYNHRQLRKELEGRGHKFVTDHSDTEVLIHGWREWGEDLIDHLEGMYALAVWDRTAARLVLHRDPFGEKPLYVQDFSTPDHPAPYVAFSSDAASIGTPPLADVMPENMARVCEYLDVGYAWNGETLFSSDEWPLRQVENHGGCDRGWRGCERTAAGATALSFDVMLEEAVRRRLEADVPLGCFLSGGIDSSLVACFARKHKPDLRTFTVRMPDSRYDESGFAEAAASHLRTIHTTLDAAVRPAEDLVHLISVLGQPFGDSSILPTYWVSKAARQAAKVALSGDGGDELFLGYERYRAVRLIRRFHAQLRLLPAGPLLRAHPKSTRHKLGRVIEMSRNYPCVGVHALESIFTAQQINELTNATAPWTWEDDRDDAVAELREFDLQQYLPNDLLTKVDAASMACGLEVRCPFLDRDLARAALSAPIETLMPGGQRKGLLRQIARKYLPREIVDRPKMGFAIPIGEWFRDDNLPAPGGGMKTLLLDHLNSAEPFGPIQLNRKAVQRFIDEHMSGKRDHGQRLFTLLTLSIWARQQARR